MSASSVTLIGMEKDIDPISYTQRVADLRKTFESGKTLDLNFRLTQLRSLLRLYEENNDAILDALYKDMRKSKLEGYLYEVDLMKNDCRGAIRNLREWAKSTFIKRNWLVFADRAAVERVPYGVVLVIGTWNYPFQLTLVPMCGAIAAGNCVIIKPSEVSSHSAALMAQLIPRYLSSDCYQVVLGGPTETCLLLEERFDYIFYTGSYNIGKKIHAAANKYLTPVTLELGGKSPVYVDDTVNFAMAARRIMWGKCMNMGQTCVAPDYIICSKKVEGELVKEIKLAMKEWYGDDLKKAKDLSRIGHKAHYQRLIKFLSNSGKIAMGGGVDESELWIEPSILIDVKTSDPIMEEEVFGPILPFITMDTPEEAISFINSRGKPLAMYVFSSYQSRIRQFLTSTNCGGFCANDTLYQMAIDELPFGGVGESGMGSYHGKFSFDTFTHEKGVVYRDYSFLADKVGLFRYPPYTEHKINFLSFLLCHWKKFKITYFDYIPHFVCFILGILLILFIQYLNKI